MNNLALWYYEIADYQSAEQMLLESLESQGGPMAEKHPNVASSMALLAYIYVDSGRFEEARQLAVDARDIFEATLPENHWRTIIATSAEGAALSGLCRFEDAEGLLLTSYEALTAQGSALPVFVKQVTKYLALLYERWEKPDEAMRFTRMLAD